MEKIVINRIANDQLVLPPMPAVALKCLTLLKNPDFSLKEAATLIERDPILTVQVIKLANSAAMATREPVQSVLQAVTRFGVQKLRTFLIEVVGAQGLRVARRAHRRGGARRLGALAGGGDAGARRGRVLQQRRRPTSATSAGCCTTSASRSWRRCCWRPRRRSWARRPRISWIGSAEWIGIIQRIHRQVGVALAKKWEMAEPVCRSIKDCDEYDNSDRLSVANAVRFANAVAKQQGLYVGPVDADDIEALVMIGRSLLGLEADVLPRLTEGLKAKVRDQMT